MGMKSGWNKINFNSKTTTAVQITEMEIWAVNID
jgi:hypothetical protein